MVRYKRQSKDMYQIGHRAFHSKRYLAVAVVVLLVILCAGLLIWRDLGRNNASTTDSSPVVTTTEQIVQAAKVRIDEPLFSLELPNAWEEVRRQQDPEQIIEWKGTTRDDNAQSMVLYIDTIPETMAVNRLLPVAAEGSRLSVGNISDNCTAFTDGGDLTPQTLSNARPTAAKWEQVDFICDLPNYLRNVIGTGSVGNINRVRVAGSQGAEHSYFFVYTDHGAHPDDSTAVAIIKSFQAK